MNETKKDFYKITAMSEAFRKWETGGTEAAEFERLGLWRLRFLLAIAQQLSVIASHLGKIVGKAEQLNDENSNGPKQ